MIALKWPKTYMYFKPENVQVLQCHLAKLSHENTTSHMVSLVHFAFHAFNLVEGCGIVVSHSAQLLLLFQIIT